jgi:hypothetical protein
MNRWRRFADDCVLALSVIVILQSLAAWEMNSRPIPRETEILQSVNLPRSYRHVFCAGLPITCAAVDLEVAE